MELSGKPVYFFLEEKVMKILIINPPFYRLQRASLVHYPASCCFMAATLEKAGFESLIYNADFDQSKKTILGNTNHLNVKALTELSAEYDKRLHDDNDIIWQDIHTYITNYSPDVLIISVFNTTLTAGLKVGKIAKEINPKILTIYEGSANRGLHCAIDPSLEINNPTVDFAIRKEPELTIVELMEAFSKDDKDFSSIKGLSWKQDSGKVVHNEDRPFIEDLDSLPFPARHLLDGYKDMPPHTFQGIYGSRGCPYKCIFCGCHTSYGFKPRLRSAKSMVDEMEYTYNRFGTRYFYICDDILFIKKERAHQFCNILIDRKLPIYWSGQTRAEMVDDKTLHLMKKAGGQHVAVGVEVGNPEVRKLIKKGNTVEDVRNCAKLIKKHGLYMVAFCIIGLPWEGRKEIEDTIKLIKEIDPYIVFPYMPTPAVGTELAKIMLQKNPEGLAEYRDSCHVDTSKVLSEKLDPEEKQRVIEDAISELIKINKKNLFHDVLKRPGFYLALAHDMSFMKKPLFFLNYLKDYAFG